MRRLRTYRKESLASVHVLDLEDGGGPPRLIEAVESVQPPVPRHRKWVLIVSTFAGCPVGCPMCDAGTRPGRRLTAAEILAQIDLLVTERYPDRALPQDKWKIQFSRMGEPALNPAVIDVLDALPGRYRAPGLLPSLSTVAPAGREAFFERLLEVQRRHYGGGRFQLQFSIHSTDPEQRRRLVPVRTWDLATIARYGERFHRDGERKVTLNFAPAADTIIEAGRVAALFDPARFIVKLTPLNPTDGTRGAGLRSAIDPARPASARPLVEAFERHGFSVLLSIGEVEENAIGSNCGQFVTDLLDGTPRVRRGYASERYVVVEA